MLAIAQRLDAHLWLRGGWAMDFFLGQVTRAHADIDWFLLADDAGQFGQALVEDGFVDVTTAHPGQQLDLRTERVEHGFALIQLDDRGAPVVAGGPWAGEPWPARMLPGLTGRIDAVAASIIAPEAQIEIKQMMPVWNPSLRRRQKDVDDIATIRRALKRRALGRRARCRTEHVGVVALHVEEPLELSVRGELDDDELDALHAAAFDHDPAGGPWGERLARHSFFWVTARVDGALVGFVNMVGDGGAHAILLDLCVDPSHQGRGIGVALVRAAADEAAARGCRWLHADYAEEHAGFYEQVCGLRPTRAGLLRLS